MLRKILLWSLLAVGAVGVLILSVQGLVDGYAKSGFVGIAAVVGGAIVGFGYAKRSRAFDRAGVDGTALILVSEIARIEGQLCEVGLLLKISIPQLDLAPAVYRIFRLPRRFTEHFVAGARLRVRCLPNDLSVIRVLDIPPAGPGTKPGSFECRLSRIPLATAVEP